MQAFKVENYERVNGPGTFVAFHHLTREESSTFREALCKCLKLSKKTSPEAVVQTVQARSHIVRELDAQKDDFDLCEVLSQLCLNLPETMYLNWYRYDDIDEIRSADIINRFHDIWYPSADDLDLVDSKMSWILSIHHSGTVSFLKLIENTTTSSESAGQS